MRYLTINGHNAQITESNSTRFVLKAILPSGWYDVTDSEDSEIMSIEIPCKVSIMTEFSIENMISME
jgi:hypothetical protein